VGTAQESRQGSDPPLGAPGPGSLTWELAGDWRLYLIFGRGLLLQVGHPVVAAGVRDHSTFQQDPYARLDRTLRGVLGIAYGEQDAAERGAELRHAHRPIGGVDAYGRRYHAFDPEAFHWVHATLFESVHTGTNAFIRRLSPAESEQLYQETRQIGRLYGVREQDMPPDLESFWRYYDEMLGERLEDNDMVRTVLATTAQPGPPPWWRLPEPLWTAMSRPALTVLMFATVGTLPESARRRWGISWSPWHQLAHSTLSSAIRLVGRPAPSWLRYQPIARRAMADTHRP
jgi:uncharacterized protein (DUF2236 family)